MTIQFHSTLKRLTVMVIAAALGIGLFATGVWAGSAGNAWRSRTNDSAGELGLALRRADRKPHRPERAARLLELRPGHGREDLRLLARGRAGGPRGALERRAVDVRRRPTLERSSTPADEGRKQWSRSDGSGNWREADRFLDAVPTGPAALVLEGEPGNRQDDDLARGCRRRPEPLLPRARLPGVGIGECPLVSRARRPAGRRVRRHARCPSRTTAPGARSRVAAIARRGLSGPRGRRASARSRSCGLPRPRHRRCSRSTTCSGWTRRRPTSSASSRTG